MKHAYLIMAHDQLEQLKRLLCFLDHEDNDLYLHIDKKAGDIDEKAIGNVVKNSKLFFLERMDIVWGDYTQIQLELNLLQEAVKKDHDYYHLISGADFPIKSLEKIDAFFEKQKGKEFIHFDKKTDPKDIAHRMGQYHFLQHTIGRRQNLLRKIDTLCEKLQKIVGIDRMKKYPLEYQKGANWFSITHELACYVLDKKMEIERMFCKSICADEVFLQTFVYNSSFRDKLFFSQKEGRWFHQRYVDWNRGNPYVFREDDLEELLETECLFARKMDESVSKSLIDRLVEINS